MTRTQGDGASGQQTAQLFDQLFSTDRMRAIFSDRGRLQGMLDFEAALARAEARVGVVPAGAAEAIAAQCRAELLDVETLARETVPAGNPAIPLVKRLTSMVAASHQEAARFVHWGATSQDAMDTGLVLQVRDALDTIEGDLAWLCGALARLAELHRDTILAGRTWLQQALPVTLGLKAVGWLSAVERHRARLAETRRSALVLQFGGAAGTLAALGDRGLEVAAALGDELSLAVPDLPWHAHRDRVAEVAADLGLLIGTLGKIARDVSLLMQTEVGEAFELAAPGRGGSSTMPHKRNPVGCAVVLAAAMRAPALVSTMLSAMVAEHERGLGVWHAEWETLPELFLLAAGALANIVPIVEGLEVDPARMRRNLDLTHGLMLAEAVTMALGAQLGRQEAHELVESACRLAVAQGRHLRAVLEDDPRVTAHLTGKDLERLLDPTGYLGVAGRLVDRVLGKEQEDGTP